MLINNDVSATYMYVCKYYLHALSLVWHSPVSERTDEKLNL